MVLASDEHTIACYPRALVSVMTNLGARQIKCVRDIGFGKLLQLYSFSVGILLCKFLANKYDSKEDVFQIGDVSLPLTVWDVECIMGLKSEGKKVVVRRGEVASADLFKTYANPAVGTITFDHLSDEIEKDDIADEHFIRRFTLLVIGTLLAPKLRGVVPSEYLKLVEDVSEIEGMNWAEFTRNELLKGIKDYNKDKTGCLKGNLLLLEFWYFEHWRSPKDVPKFIHIPLMVNWDEDRIKSRQSFEVANGHGSGDFVRRLSNTPVKNVAFKEKGNTSRQHATFSQSAASVQQCNSEEYMYLGKRMDSLEQKLDLLLAEIARRWPRKNMKDKLSQQRSNVEDASEGSQSHNLTGSAEELSTEGLQEQPAADPEVCIREKNKEFSGHPFENASFADSDGSPKIRQPQTPTSLVERVKSRKRKRSCLASLFKLKPQVTEYQKLAYKFAMDHHLSDIPLTTMDSSNISGILMQELTKPKGWLSSKIMDAYIYLIHARKAVDTKVCLANTATIHSIQSTAKSKHPTRRTINFLARKAGYWLNHDMVMFPINYENLHWFVGVLHFGKEEFQILDSSAGFADPYEKSTSSLRTAINQAFQAVANDPNINLKFQEPDICKWPVTVIKDIPEQKDDSSCGVFALKFMEYWDGDGLSTSFTHVDIVNFRKQMAADMITSEENIQIGVRREIHELALKKKIKCGELKEY